MATARFETPPPPERQVVVTMSEAQARRLRTILGNSNCAVNGVGPDLWEALCSLFPNPGANEAGWAIRKPDGRIA